FQPAVCQLHGPESSLITRLLVGSFELYPGQGFSYEVAPVQLMKYDAYVRRSMKFLTAGYRHTFEMQLEPEGHELEFVHDCTGSLYSGRSSSSRMPSVVFAGWSPTIIG